MKKRWAVVVAILLCIIVASATSQITKRENIPNDLILFIAYAKGVSENIDCAVNGASTETVSLAMSGINNYFYWLISATDGLHDLCEDEANEFTDFQLALNQTYGEIISIYTKYHNSGKQLTSEDQQFLVTVKRSLDLLLDAMQQKDGDIDLRVLNEKYFLRVISDFLMLYG